MGMITVRTAGLADAGGISAVHQSDVLTWHRLNGAAAEYGDLTILERYLNGGPWMAPESCAVYINDLILASTPPIIALCDERIIGEMELLYGDDLPEFGRTVCLSILYIDRAWRGHGAGQALIAEALRRGRALDCMTVESTDPEVDALSFYERQGFRLTTELAALTVPLCGSGGGSGSGGSDVAAVAAVELVPSAALTTLAADMPLVIGRQRHPALIKQLLRQCAGRGLLAIPGVGDLVRAFRITTAGEEATVFFRAGPLGKGVARAHVFAPSINAELVEAVVRLAAVAGYPAVELAVRSGADELLVAGADGRRSIQIHTREL